MRYRVSLVYGHSTDPASDLLHAAEQAGVALYSLPTLVRRVAPGRDVQTLWGLACLFRRLRADLVHTHTSKAGILGRVAARWAGVSRVVHTAHGHIFQGYFPAWQLRAFLSAERWAAHLTDRLISLTDAETRQHLERGIGRPGQFCTIHSGVDLEQFSNAVPQSLAPLGIGDDLPVVGTLGRMTAVKDFPLLLDVFEQIAATRGDVHLVLAGSGEEEDALRALVNTHPYRERIRVLPWQAEPWRLLARFSVFVLTSRNEGMGRVLVEAMAAGVPVVATDVGGVSEVLGGGQAGVLIPRDARAAAHLAGAVLHLLADSSRRQTLITAGRRRARDYSIQAMMSRLLALYDELLSVSGG